MAAVAAPLVGAVVSVAGLGVAGGTLSGAAASSAGLAALGGGAIASGGLGVAGGTVVVSAVGGAVGTLATARTIVGIHKSGRDSANGAARARSESVEEGDIKFES